MKSVKIASFLLASGMLLGTVHTAVTPAYTAHAAQEPVVKAPPVSLEGKVEVVGGRITGFNDTITDAELKQIFGGGELMIPKTSGTETITGIADNAFDRYTLGSTHSILNDLSGITTLNFETSSNINYVGKSAFSGNEIKGELNLENVTEIGDRAFEDNQLTGVKLPIVEIIGERAFANNDIKGELNLPKVTTINRDAFFKNAISGDLNLPEAITIGIGAFFDNKISGKLSLEKNKTISDRAFDYNHITDVYLPNTETIGMFALGRNNLTRLKLGKVTSIDEYAFAYNALMDIDLPEDVVIAMYAFLGQTFEVERTANEQGEVAFDELFSADEVPSLKKGGMAQKIKISRVSHYSGSNFYVDRNNKTINLIDSNTRTEAEVIIEFSNMTNFGDYLILPMKLTIIPNESSSGGDNENGGDGGDNENGGDGGDNENGGDGEDNENGGDGGGNENGGDGEGNENGGDGEGNENGGDGEGNENGGDGGGNVGDNENNEADTSQTPDTTAPGTSIPDVGNNETPIVISPDPELNRPHTVYAKRAMRLHSSVSLTSPTKSYKKRSRAKAPSFRVLGVSYDQNGKKRYKVKGGYITASTKYVADSHFRSSKVKQVRVIGNRVNSYKNVKLSKSQKVRSYKKGTKIKVKRIVKHGRTTRFQLNNGRYITGNKQLLIMDHSK